MIQRPIDVLLVSDDAERYRLLGDLLLTSLKPEFSLRWARTAMEAKERIDRCGIDVVIYDLGLPLWRGDIRVLTCAVDGGCAVLLLADGSSPGCLQEILNAGVHDVLAENDLTRPRLLAALSAALHRMRQHKRTAADVAVAS